MRTKIDTLECRVSFLHEKLDKSYKSYGEVSPGVKKLAMPREGCGANCPAIRQVILAC